MSKRKSINIEASGDKMPDKVMLTAKVDVVAAAGEGKRPTFEIQAYNGGEISVGAFYHPVILEMAGMKASRDKLPILMNHNTDRPVGQADRVEINAQGVTLAGSITGDDGDSANIVSHAKNGFEWQASIGARVIRREFLEAGKKAKVNGRDVTGPLNIGRESVLYETSFVTIGADQTTTAKVAANHKESKMNKFNEWLTASGFDPDNLSDAQKKPLKAQFEAENKPAEPAEPKPKARTNVSLEEIKAERKRTDDISAMVVDYARRHPTQIEQIEAMGDRAVEEKLDAQALELELLRACRSAPANTNLRRGSEEQVDGDVVEAAICMAGGLSKIEKHFSEQTLDAAHKKHRHGLGLEEVLVMAARQRGSNILSAKNVHETLKAAFNDHVDVRAAFSTISLPTIFSNVMNKFLLQGFSAVEDNWRSIARVRPVRDFKQVTNVRRLGSTLFDKIGPDGELKHGTLGEETFTNKAETYGGMYGITRHDIINDDLGALTSVPNDIGRDGAIRLNKQFWSEFMDNSTFFTTGRGNLIHGTTGVLAVDSLTNAELSFFNMKDGNGNPLGIQPKILLVPNALNVTASQLSRDLEVRDTNTSKKYTTGNPHAGKFEAVRSSYLSDATITGNSTTAWYLLASPQDMPAIEVVFLNGIQQPTVEQAEANFNTLGIQMRGYFDFGVAKQEYRAAVKTTGVADPG